MPTTETSKLEQWSGDRHPSKALCRCLNTGVVLVSDAESRAVLTPEAKQLLDFSSGQPMEVSLDLLPVPLVEFIRETLRDRKPATRHFKFLARDGRPIALRANTLPLALLGTRSGVAVVLSDLTGAAQFEEHIYRLDRLANLGTLAATMAHEIKNALVAGKTFIDLLLEKNPETELAGVVRRELGRIDAIVSRMLKFGGPSGSTFGPVHIHELLDHSLRLLQPQFESKSIAAERSFQASADLVNGDEYELQQAFLNLFLNALEAMGPDGKLSVATQLLAGAATAGGAQSPERPQVQIAIQDSGAGVPPAQLERLFEPFFTTKPSGTGLGLAITRRILEDHQGGISAASQPGKGTTFTVLLPILSSP